MMPIYANHILSLYLCTVCVICIGQMGVARATGQRKLDEQLGIQQQRPAADMTSIMVISG